MKTNVFQSCRFSFCLIDRIRSVSKAVPSSFEKRSKKRSKLGGLTTWLLAQACSRPVRQVIHNHFFRDKAVGTCYVCHWAKLQHTALKTNAAPRAHVWAWWLLEKLRIPASSAAGRGIRAGRKPSGVKLEFGRPASSRPLDLGCDSIC